MYSDSPPPLTLPPLPAPARRSSVPLLASVVPVVGAVALWVFTGSVFALWFAALGPLIALATAIDARRSTRRERRRGARDRERTCERLRDVIAARHAQERAALWAQHPDVLGYLDDPREIWRAVPGREGTLVVGRGRVASAVRVTGDEDADLDALRERALALEDAPVVVPAADGIVVAGPPALAEAVARALVVQLCCRSAPGVLGVPGAHEQLPDWARALPHRRFGGHVSCLLDARGAVARGAADAAVVVVAPGAPPPPQCAAVLTITGIGTARLDHAGRTRHVRVEALGEEQALRIATQLAHRAAAIGGIDRVPDAVAFGELAASRTAVPGLAAPGLAVPIGRDGVGDACVDLVADGPHAVVVGVTGAGKSELLITWIAALCAAHSTREVVFLLADFKGGTAFDTLARLPHVTGVLTDLDGAGARRALESLRAELRHRESVLAGVGARDIDDPAVDLPRLVIVVDEFAALLQTHTELGALFADVGARGRALGMHLVLGTQRASGVLRDALLANCPLRIALRVADPADSRLVVGTDAAAALPGDLAGRGLALVRRAADAAPRLIRVARTTAADVAGLAADSGEEPPPRRPWQPALPAEVALAEFDAPPEGVLVLGLADEPEHQRHVVAGLAPADAGLLVVGGPGSGRTTAVAVLAAQVGRARTRWPGPDPESFWDALCELSSSGAPPGTLVVWDDLDAALAALPPDYAAEAFAMIERLTRSGRALGWRVAISAGRLAGPIARLADLLPRRLLLRVASRVDHLAAGGEVSAYDANASPGRGLLDGRVVQVARVPPREAPVRTAPPVWMPDARPCGVVLRGGAAGRRLSAALAEHGLTALPLAEHGLAALPLADAAESGSETQGVVFGEPESWQRSWRVLERIRGEGDLVIDAGCGAEYRLLTGDRMIPPYCVPGQGRGWLVREGDAPVRVRLLGQGAGALRRGG